MSSTGHAPAAEPPTGKPESAAYVSVDPTADPRWDGLILSGPQATVFHGAGWANVLKQTYGHSPAYVCRFEGARLAELLPVMEAASPVAGRRGVALPFSDFCPPLKSSTGGARALYQAAADTGRRRGWKYLECRGGWEDWEGAKESVSFYGHTIDLTAGVEQLGKRLDGSVRRGIRKAGDAGLKVDFDSGSQSVKNFYALHCKTRRRHGLPPQPFRFFKNIQRHLLEPGQGFIATARLSNRPLAAAVFLCFGAQVLYKFGASDPRYLSMRPNNLAMWSAIEHSVARGFSSLHLGRTSLGNEGLRRFKLGFGAEEDAVRYCRFDFQTNKFVVDEDRAEESWFNPVFRRMPLPLLRLAGRMLYPHLS